MLNFFPLLSPVSRLLLVAMLGGSASALSVVGALYNAGVSSSPFVHAFCFLAVSVLLVLLVFPHLLRSLRPLAYSDSLSEAVTVACAVVAGATLISFMESIPPMNGVFQQVVFYGVSLVSVHLLVAVTGGLSVLPRLIRRCLMSLKAA